MVVVRMPKTMKKEANKLMRKQRKAKFRVDKAKYGKAKAIRRAEKRNQERVAFERGGSSGLHKLRRGKLMLKSVARQKSIPKDMERAIAKFL
jgi:hypothetical protein